MRALWRRRVLSAVLAAGVATAGLPGMGRAADEPDLKIEPGDVRLFMNAGGQVNDRVVSFKVTNVGNRDVPISEATGTLAVTSPPPAAEVPLQNDRGIAKNGGTFEGVAPLPAPCDGTVVTVSLFAKGETNRANNTLGPLKLCPDQPKPATKPGGEPDAGIISGPRGIDIAEELTEPTLETISRGIDIADELTEHLQPGEHTLEFAPSALRSMGRVTNGRVHGPGGDFSRPDLMAVGWLGHGPRRRYDLVVWQTAVNFNLAELLEVPRPRVSEAYLSFVEFEHDWIDTDGLRVEGITGCVARLGYATNDWSGPPRSFMSPDFLFRDRPLTDLFLPQTQTTTGESGDIQRWRAFDVTDHIKNRVANRDDPTFRFGYVLHGQVEGDDRTDTSCFSGVGAIGLWVTYVVPSS